MLEDMSMSNLKSVEKRPYCWWYKSLHRQANPTKNFAKNLSDSHFGLHLASPSLFLIYSTHCRRIFIQWNKPKFNEYFPRYILSNKSLKLYKQSISENKQMTLLFIYVIVHDFILLFRTVHFVLFTT